MKRSQTIFISFFLCLLVALLLWFVSSKFEGITFIQSLFAPAQKTALQASRSVHSSPEIDKLKQENTALKTQIAQMNDIKQDNQAFRDQFQTTNPAPKDLLPATIVNLESFLPGMSAPEALVIDKGTADHVKVGYVVVYKDSVIGKVVRVNAHFARILLLTNASVVLTGKTSASGALGIVRGQGGGQILFDNVLLSENLKAGDTIVTTGDTKLDGTGFPEGLIIGEITSVEKNPSALFQRANVKNLVDVTKLSTIFVLRQ